MFRRYIFFVLVGYAVTVHTAATSHDTRDGAQIIDNFRAQRKEALKESQELSGLVNQLSSRATTLQRQLRPKVKYGHVKHAPDPVAIRDELAEVRSQLKKIQKRLNQLSLKYSFSYLDL